METAEVHFDDWRIIDEDLRPPVTVDLLPPTAVKAAIQGEVRATEYPTGEFMMVIGGDIIDYRLFQNRDINESISNYLVIALKLSPHSDDLVGILVLDQ